MEQLCVQDFWIDHEGLRLDLRFDPKSSTLSGSLFSSKGEIFSPKFIQTFCESAILKSGSNTIFLEPANDGNGTLARFSGHIPQDSMLGRNVSLYLRDQPLKSFSLDHGIMLNQNPPAKILTSFETRLLMRGANTPKPGFGAPEKTALALHTDLHTHFNGCLRGADLIRIGTEKEGGAVLYPIALLDREGIDYPKDAIVHRPDLSFAFKSVDGPADLFVPLDSLSHKAQDKLAAAMSVPVDKCITFNELEEIYDLRRVISDDKALFKKLLWQVAADYVKQGVQYAELSMTQILDPEILKIVHEEMPKIKEHYKTVDHKDIHLGFRATISRHSPKERLDDQFETYKLLAKSPYIVGPDFAGNEDNETPVELIEKYARWSKKNNLEMSIQVHAGESGAYPNNVFKALKIAKKYGVKMLIGHGAYGLDSKTLAIARELADNDQVIIQVNPDSLLALNNLNHLHNHPLPYYLGVIPTIISTDGYGIYRTDSRQAAHAATILGANDRGMHYIKDTEDKYASEGLGLFERKQDQFPEDFFETLQLPAPSYTKECRAKLAEERQEEREILFRNLPMKLIENDPQKIEKKIAGKVPLLINGSGKATFPLMSPEWRKETRIAFAMLARFLNPKTTYIMTGCTDHGVDGLLFEAFHEQEKKTGGQFRQRLLPEVAIDGGDASENSPNHMIIRGSLAEAAKVHEINRGTATDAVICGQSWMDVQAANVKHALERGGQAVAIGGGPYVATMIMLAANAGLPFHLYDGPEGMATEKAEHYPDNTFTKPQQLLRRIYEQNPNMFKESFDVNKLDEYYKETKTEIETKINRELVEGRKAGFAVSVLLHYREPLSYDLTTKKQKERELLVFKRENGNEEEQNNTYSVVSGRMDLSPDMPHMELRSLAQWKTKRYAGFDPVVTRFVPMESYLDSITDKRLAILVQPYSYELDRNEMKELKEHIEKVTPGSKTYNKQYALDYINNSNNQTDVPMMKPLSEAKEFPFLYKREPENIDKLEKALKEVRPSKTSWLYR